jgi:environmental stress-induced protein Ves
MRTLRAAERTAQPWKNGGGLTYEVIVHPPGSSLAQFDWRVSLAHVRAAGPFSFFPGIERRLAVLEGELRLSFGTRAGERAEEVRVLAPPSSPLAFPGEARVFAEPRGAVTDLNVMVRRGRFAACLERYRLGQPLRLGVTDATRVLIALGDLTAHGGAGDTELAPLDALLIDGTERCDLSGRGDGAALYVAEISPAGG